MDHLKLLYKYMAHLYQLEDSTFIELINTPFSKEFFNSDELNMLRKIELEIIASNRKLRVKAEKNITGQHSDFEAAALQIPLPLPDDHSHE